MVLTFKKYNPFICKKIIMKTFTITNIDKEWYYELEEKMQEWVRTVYIDSGGWSVPYSILMRRLLESYNVELILLYQAQSAGFNIFYDYTKTKKLVKWCFAMYHRSHSNILIKDSGDLVWVDRVALDSMKQTQLKKLPFMNKKERKQFERWEEVYFDFERLKEIFKWIEIVE